MFALPPFILIKCLSVIKSVCINGKPKKIINFKCICTEMYAEKKGGKIFLQQISSNEKMGSIHYLYDLETIFFKPVFIEQIG